MSATRRLLLLVGAIVLLDTMFFAAITPLLPYYRDELGLTKGSAGLLVASYPAGTLLGSLPGGWLAARGGVKPALLLGLALLMVSSVAFGLGNDISILVAARFVQGIGGAASWSAGLAWLIGVAEPQRRAELIATAFSAAIVGALLGPVLGTAARALSPETIFTGIAAAACGLGLWASREHAPARSSALKPSGAPRDAALLVGLAVIVLVGLFFGAIEVVVPLRLDALGAGSAAIGATFLGAAALQAASGPAVGRLVDRAGPLPVIRVSLTAAALTALLLPTPTAAWPLIVLMVVAGPIVGSLWVPGMAIVSEAAERTQLDQAYAFALVNLGWAGAQVLGAAGGGKTAEAAGDRVALLLLAAVMAVSLALTAARPARLR